MWAVTPLSGVLLGPGVLLAAGAEGGHGKAAESPVIVPPTVWAIASFLFVLFVLWKKVLPQLIQVMDKRAEAIREGLEAAERAKAETKALAEAHAAEMQKARAEATAVIEEGKADAQRLKEGILAEARDEAEAILARGLRDIEQAKHAAVDELQGRAVDLAFDLASRLVKKSLSQAEHQDLIQERIRNLPAS